MLSLQGGMPYSGTFLNTNKCKDLIHALTAVLQATNSEVPITLKGNNGLPRCS
jgi:hypothetical protein